MKEFRGTPGEWRLYKDCNERWHVIGPGTDTLASCWHPGRNPGSMEDNARLMAASKDLLEALSEIISSIDSYGCGFADGSDSFWAGVDKARAAIRKALGE